MEFEAQIAKAVDQIRRRLQEADPTPWLVGYDVMSIQELVASNSRPAALSGASGIVKKFDEDLRTGRLEAIDPDLYAGRCVFAGGGRGTFLARSEKEAERLEDRIRTVFRDLTKVGMIVTARAPLLKEAQEASLRLLSHRLEQPDKPADAPPQEYLPDSASQVCQDCGTFRSTRQDHQKQKWVCANVV